MPYKDPEHKKEWERLHRSKRLARRRELRQAEAAREQAQHEAPRPLGGASALLLPLAAGSALAAYNPKLAIGAGGLTLAAAAFYKKDWSWWIVGVLILVIGLLFQWNEKTDQK
jgi:ferric-dicitrate binding protein FerR (iron transport regulator)